MTVLPDSESAVPSVLLAVARPRYGNCEHGMPLENPKKSSTNKQKCCPNASPDVYYIYLQGVRSLNIVFFP